MTQPLNLTVENMQLKKRAKAAEERAETLEELVMDVVADLRDGVSASKIDYRIGKVMQKMEWKDE